MQEKILMESFEITYVSSLYAECYSTPFPLIKFNNISIEIHHMELKSFIVFKKFLQLMKRQTTKHNNVVDTIILANAATATDNYLLS